MEDLLIDTHCHIQLIDDNSTDLTTKLWHRDGQLALEEVLKNARSDGVNKMISVGCNLYDSKLAVELAKQHSNIYASIGIHPHEAKVFKSNLSKNKIIFENLLKRERITAIGECGLDYHYELSPRKDQIDVLIWQLGLAEKYNLPMIFHVREAFDDFWQILADYPNTRGVLHSFTDNKDNLNLALERGLMIGINGIITFVKNPVQLKVYQSVPINRILLETDSPYLTPVPHRGRINEPRNVRIITKYLAQLFQVEEKIIAQNSSLNAENLFNFSKKG